MKNIEIAKTREKNLAYTLRSHGHIVSDPQIQMRNMYDLLYTDNSKKLNRSIGVCTIVNSRGEVIPSLRSGKPINRLTTRDLMKLGTDYRTLVKQFGLKVADKICGLDEIPF